MTDRGHSSLREIVQALISEESKGSIVKLRTPGSSHSSYAASHPIKMRQNKSPLGYERGMPDEEQKDFTPVRVSRAFSARS
jgi:hypothetical protein